MISLFAISLFGPPRQLVASLTSVSERVNNFLRYLAKSYQIASRDTHYVAAVPDLAKGGRLAHRVKLGVYDPLNSLRII